MAGGAFIFGGIALDLWWCGDDPWPGNDDSSGDAAAAAAPAAAVVDIKLSEFAMTPAMPAVPAGDVTLRVTNTGTLVHNLTFNQGAQHTRDLQPGESQTITVKNVAEGEMPFLCTIPGHSASGMTGMLMAGAADAGATTDSATPTTMSYQQMDAAMEERAMRFVNEPKGTFGGTRLEPTVLADGTKEFDLTAEDRRLGGRAGQDRRGLDVQRRRARHRRSRSTSATRCASCCTTSCPSRP